MTRVVISERFGGFGLSPAATARMRDLGYEGRDWELKRDDPRLLQVVEELGDAASGVFAELVIVEVPDDADWYIHEYDGNESVYEKHRAWDSDGERMMEA